MTLRKEDIDLINKLTQQSDNDDSPQGNDWDQYKKILETSAKWTVPVRSTVKFSDLVSQMDRKPVSKPVSSKKIHWMIAAAVSLIVFVSGWFYQISRNVEVDVPLAMMQTVWLPDSSKVVLNAGAKLSYSKAKWENKDRSVALEGVAYFEVKKGSRFVVTTMHGNVAVLGTSFNVKALKEDFIVECITGKVAVTTDKEEVSVELTPGFKTKRDSESKLLIPISFDLHQGKEWMSGVFNFENQSLNEVWAEFERQFNVKVAHNDLEHRFYTGTFSNKDMQKALNGICKPMGLEYEIDESKNLIRINN